MEWENLEHTGVVLEGLHLDCRVEASPGVNHNLPSLLEGSYQFHWAKDEDF